MTEEPVAGKAAAENTAAASGAAPGAGEHESPENGFPVKNSPTAVPPSPKRRRGNRRAVSSGSSGSAGLLPVTAKEDDPRMWGDGPEDSESWLLEQRPPHWG